MEINTVNYQIIGLWCCWVLMCVCVRTKILIQVWLNNCKNRTNHFYKPHNVCSVRTEKIIYNSGFVQNGFVFYYFKSSVNMNFETYPQTTDFYVHFLCFFFLIFQNDHPVSNYENNHFWNNIFCSRTIIWSGFRSRMRLQ